MGRSRRADVIIRPFLDAFQVIPPFVYLVPALALFAPSRFTAIVAAVAYAFPIATKLVADGIRGVAPTTVEAARSSGITRWQMITKVQLPMARESLVLATNQGLLYVLSMVVIGGMVGGGSLGYLVVSGLQPGPAVRQGPRGRGRDRRARRDARPDRAVRRGAGRALTHTDFSAAVAEWTKKGRTSWHEDQPARGWWLSRRSWASASPVAAAATSRTRTRPAAGGKTAVTSGSR